LSVVQSFVLAIERSPTRFFWRHSIFHFVGSLPIGVEPDEGFDMIREWKEIEDLEPRKPKMSLCLQAFEIVDETVEPASQIDESIRRACRERLTESTIEPASGRIDQNDFRAVEGIEAFAR